MNKQFPNEITKIHSKRRQNITGQTSKYLTVTNCQNVYEVKSTNFSLCHIETIAEK